MNDPLPEDRRREIFAALVSAQDGGLSVATSRLQVAADQNVNAEQLCDIEQEGLAAQWPPLGE